MKVENKNEARIDAKHWLVFMTKNDGLRLLLKLVGMGTVVGIPAFSLDIQRAASTRRRGGAPCQGKVLMSTLIA